MKPMKKPAHTPESYTPKEMPEIMKLAGEIKMNKPCKVKTANGGSYIDGMPELRWGQFRDCTYSGCLALWLNAMGVDATYEQAAGLTGSCYRLSMCYGWDPGSIIVNTSYHFLRFKNHACGTDGNANQAFGFAFYNVKDPAERDEKVRKSIDAGVPVLLLGGWGAPEWCVLTGYEKTENGVEFFGRTYFDSDSVEKQFRTTNHYTLFDNYPGEFPDVFVKLGDKTCEPLPAKDALRQSLETCLLMFGKPKNWKARKAARRVGYGAYKFMIASLRKNEYLKTFGKTKKERQGGIGWEHFSNLLDARRAAYIYLEESAALLSGENKAKLLRVAAMYREMFDTLSAVLPYSEQFKHEFMPDFTTQLRQALIAALKKMLSLEKQVRVVVKDILKHW